MVFNLTRHGSIQSPEVIFAFSNVDRGHFIDQAEDSTGEDTRFRNHPYRNGVQHLSAPGIYGTALEALELREGMSFLNVCSGTGYFSAVASQILGKKVRKLAHAAPGPIGTAQPASLAQLSFRYTIHHAHAHMCECTPLPMHRRYSVPSSSAWSSSTTHVSSFGRSTVNISRWSPARASRSARELRCASNESTWELARTRRWRGSSSRCSSLGGSSSDPFPAPTALSACCESAE
mmetsp:Transcript_46199/g.121113  ORF Transcript_46199/g.121113 Transcript_46199/m.121113 type:complete len:234 (+) Transcript_46199:331-1032(+)